MIPGSKSSALNLSDAANGGGLSFRYDRRRNNETGFRSHPFADDAEGPFKMKRYVHIHERAREETHGRR
jgi:hypothetical protein